MGRSTSTIVPLPEVKAAGQLKGQDESEVNALVAMAKPVVKKVSILRHGAFAHKGAQIPCSDVFKPAAVAPVQLRGRYTSGHSPSIGALIPHSTATQDATVIPPTINMMLASIARPL
jgi:hypothetical protein